MEVGGMFFDVRLDSHEMLVDEGCDFRIGVGLGLQPSAGASSRGGAEVNEQRFICFLRFGERRVEVFLPLDSHLFAPL